MDLNRLKKELLKRERYDYFLIWGHGMDSFTEILNILDTESSLEVVRIIKKSVDIKELINAVYSYDYAPIEHLVAKTKYLLQVPPIVAFVFVKNTDVDDVFIGDGEFKHIESRNIKRIKEEVRNKFNPREDGKRTEDHVIHASDTQLQTDHILKFLKFSKGVNSLMVSPNLILDLPSHLHKFNKFEIKEVDSKQVFCKILKEGKDDFDSSIVPIEETPHYKALTKGLKYYQDYFNKFSGVMLTDNHSVDKLLALNKEFSYNQYNNSGNYILTKQIEDKYVILDGVHRVSVLKNRGIDKFIISIIK